jgi:adenylate cyclase
MALPDDPDSLLERLLGRPELTPVEIAAVAGVGLDDTRRLWRALGFPPAADDARAFTKADADGLGVVRALLARGEVDLPVLVQLARVTGRSLARVADAQATVIETGDGGPDDLPALANVLERSITYVWRRHLVAALLRRAARPTAGEKSLSVGFADMVGFTALSQALDAHDLAAMVDRFEAVVYEHVPARGGQVVKMIGDETMFATDDPAAAAEIALAVVDAHARTPELPAIRVGLAHGPALEWEGDLYGPTVNLASRLVNVARPSSVLVAESVALALEGRPEFVLRRLRPVRLQGIGRVRGWVLRRAVPDATPVDAPKARRGVARRRRTRAGRNAPEV